MRRAPATDGGPGYGSRDGTAKRQNTESAPDYFLAAARFFFFAGSFGRDLPNEP
jgi:hypothetical protein